MINNIVGYIFLFICLHTSNNWGNPLTAKGEIFRFDKILLFDQIDIYFIFMIIFISILFFSKVSPNNGASVDRKSNYIKTIFILFFIPCNIMIYLAVYLKDIPIEGYGIYPILKFMLYVTATIYFQNLFLNKRNFQQLDKIFLIFEILILIRGFYSIIKYLRGFGDVSPVGGGVRLGTEDDFADFFILLFIISLTKLLFRREENSYKKMVHVVGLITSSIIAIFSFRRYFWLECIVAIGVILLFFSRLKKIDLYTKIILGCFILFIVLFTIILVGPGNITNNYFIGRLLTSLSIINTGFESRYGVQEGHIEEIIDGWYNIKKNWLFGLTPFGYNRIERSQALWQEGLWIHNAYMYVWIEYGLIALILFTIMYLKSIQIGFVVYKKFRSEYGLVLSTFMLCQMTKNIVWPTAISLVNVTIIYIFLISFVLKLKEELTNSQIYNNRSLIKSIGG